MQLQSCRPEEAARFEFWSGKKVKMQLEEWHSVISNQVAIS